MPAITVIAPALSATISTINITIVVANYIATVPTTNKIVASAITTTTLAAPELLFVATNVSLGVTYITLPLSIFQYISPK